MVVGKHELNAKEIRRRFRGHAEALLKLQEEGWRIVAPEGDGGAAYCPCGQHRLSFSGTPRNADNERRRILREARNRCRPTSDD